mmetsp:Transcript_19235/g.30057  ORF Transcript_19235/g.30057 Transcript_19235/m.30057 type:complete len:108 (+) Transcript_19235:492-815(+)
MFLDRFLPKFKKKNVKTKKPKEKKETVKQYTPFPPPQQQSKIDMQLESGEYFLSDEQKKSKEKAKRSDIRSQEKSQKDVERAKVFVAPKEKKRKSTEPGSNEVRSGR